jgi:hypothetical protein
MSQRSRVLNTLVVTILLLVSSSSAAYSQDDKKKKQLPQGTPVFWREPTNIESRDLLDGPGGDRMKPDLSRVTFIKEEKGGYSKKYRVKDAKGREWVAKLGKEAQSETAAVRLVWAVGYVTEINYLAPRVTIEGKGTLKTCASKRGRKMSIVSTSGVGPTIRSAASANCRGSRYSWR